MTSALTRIRSAASARAVGDLVEVDILLPGLPPAPRKRSVERLALVLLTGAIIFQPILRPGGPGNSSPVDLFTIGGIVATVLWARTSHQKLSAPYSLGVGLMLFAGCASALLGPLPSKTIVTMTIDLLLLLWTIALVNVFGNRPEALRTALKAWCLAGIGWAVVVAIAHAGHITALEGLNPLDGNRVLFTFGDPNLAAAYWDSTIFVVYATRVPTRRWPRMIGYGFLVWALILTESNGGALALGVGIVFIFIIKNYQRRGLPGALATVLIIGVTVGGFFTAVPMASIREAALTSGQSFLVNSVGRSDQSSSQRGQLLKESMSLFSRSDGIFGLGPATTKPLLTLWQYPYAKEAHDDYVATLVERGLVGVVGLLFLIGSIASRAAPIIGRGLSPGFAAAVPRPVGIVTAAVALAVAATYYQTMHFRWEWAIFAFIAILGKDARR